MDHTTAKGHAERIIESLNQFYEFSDVYEDEELEEATEEDWRQIYDLMIGAKVTVTWADD